MLACYRDFILVHPNLFHTFLLHTFPCRNAIYANRLYLRLFKKTHPEYLAGPGGENGNGNGDVTMDGPVNGSVPLAPIIFGDVRIHPTATVDPSAVVS